MLHNDRSFIIFKILVNLLEQVGQMWPKFLTKILKNAGKVSGPNSLRRQHLSTTAPKKASVFSTLGATLNGVQMIKRINVNKHCLSYVSWIFLRGTFNCIHKLVSITHFGL